MTGTTSIVMANGVFKVVKRHGEHGWNRLRFAILGMVVAEADGSHEGTWPK
jgi:hypothetical protein